MLENYTKVNNIIQFNSVISESLNGY